MMMPVEINQWRATIGCFRVSKHFLSPMNKNFRLFSLSFQILKLYWFCCSFITIAVFAIKLSDAALVVPLRIIFTNCLRCGVFPQIWKCANVVPVHKKNEKNLKGNYRPIFLLPIFGKILEKLIYDSLYSHLVSCELLNPNQSGFRPGGSQ